MIYFILANERLKSVSLQDDLAVFNLIGYFKTLLFSTTSASKQLVTCLHLKLFLIKISVSM